jgi:uncharacterized protein YggE
MKLARLAAALILLASFAAFAQTTQPSITPNTISVGADGKFEADPDTILITFGISAQEASSQEAYNHASKSAEQIRDLLRKNGIEPKTAEISYFALQPVYDFRNPKRKLVGYRSNSSVSLKLKDFTKLSSILQGLTDLDITENQQISYILDNMDEAKTKAAQDALRRARQEATAVAGSANHTLGDIVYISVDTQEQPRPMPIMAYAKVASANGQPAPTEEFSAQKITVSAHVNALFELK